MLCSSNVFQTSQGHWLSQGNTGCYFLGNGQVLQKHVSLWNFNMGVNGKNVKCVISWKRLTVDKNGSKIGTRCLMNSICKALSGSYYLLSVWGHTVQLEKFLMFKIFNRLSLFQFLPYFNQTLLKACIRGKYSPLFFLAICIEIKSIWHFEGKLPQRHCQYRWNYVGFSWHRVKPSVKAPGPLFPIFTTLNFDNGSS